MSVFVWAFTMSHQITPYYPRPKFRKGNYKMNKIRIFGYMSVFVWAFTMSHQIILKYFHDIEPYIDTYSEYFVEMVFSIWVIGFIYTETFYLTLVHLRKIKREQELNKSLKDIIEFTKELSKLLMKDYENRKKNLSDGSEKGIEKK